MNRAGILILGSIVLFAAGCTTYYKVSDPTTGKIYYTSDLQRKGSGSVAIKDARTGNTVTLQNSNISEITKEQYEAERFAPAAAPATPPR